MAGRRKRKGKRLSKQESKKHEMATVATSVKAKSRAAVGKWSSKEIQVGDPLIVGVSQTDIAVDDAESSEPVSSSWTWTPHEIRPSDDDEFDMEDVGTDDYLDTPAPSSDRPWGPRGGPLFKMGAYSKFVESALPGKGTGKTEEKEKERPASCDEPRKVNSSSGGPFDNSVIPSFKGHVASPIWLGMERKVLQCYSRSSRLKDLRAWSSTMDVSHATASYLVKASGLSHLVDCMFEHLDMPLLSAFVERWQPDTNTFHLPFGEMTIMLHDVFYILRIPVDGLMVDGYAGSDQLKTDMCKLLGISLDDLCTPPRSHWEGSGVLIGSIIDRCSKISQPPHAQSQGYLLALLGCTLFVDGSDDSFKPGPVSLLNNMGQVSHYAWGAATLALLYRQLGIASRIQCVGICGCLTLLQAWIYEYFPCFRPRRLPLESTEPRALMWEDCAQGNESSRLLMFRTELDHMTASQVNWLPYGRGPAVTVPRTIFTGNLCFQDVIEPYMPDRALRQLGYIQVVPSPIAVPEKAERPGESHKYTLKFALGVKKMMWHSWLCSQRLVLSKFQIAAQSPTTSRNYLHWYYRVSHPFVSCVPRLHSAWYMFGIVRAMEPLFREREKLPEFMGAVLDDVQNTVNGWNDQFHDQMSICTSTPF